MYVIRLKNCAFHARHGVLMEEASLGQRFFVDAELHVDAPMALESDKVEHTVHYGHVFDLIEKIVDATLPDVAPEVQAELTPDPRGAAEFMVRIIYSLMLVPDSSMTDDQIADLIVRAIVT